LATPQLARLSLVDAGLCRLQQTHRCLPAPAPKYLPHSVGLTQPHISHNRFLSFWPLQTDGARQAPHPLLDKADM